MDSKEYACPSCVYHEIRHPQIIGGPNTITGISTKDNATRICNYCVQAEALLKIGIGKTFPITRRWVEQTLAPFIRLVADNPKRRMKL